MILVVKVLSACTSYSKVYSKVSFDHLDSCENGGPEGERYGHVMQDEGSEAEGFFATVNRAANGVVAGLRHVCIHA